jgi:2-dehydro-3-deoxy-D-pentonate aldolase
MNPGAHRIPPKGSPLRGIIVPMVSPLLAEDEVDVDGLERLLEHMLAGGVHGFFALGTCGEGPSLHEPTRRAVVEKTCQIVNGRVPVLVSVADTSPAASRSMAQFAMDVGATAAVAAPPYYLPLEPNELIIWARSLARSIPLPLILYNMPGLTKVWYTPAVVQTLLDEENIIGMKDSSGDLTYFRELANIKAQRPEWTLLMGPEHLLVESMQLGGDGGVNGGANVCPKIFANLFRAIEAKDARETEIGVAKAQQLGEIYQFGSGAAAVIRGLKGALAEKGICSGFVAPPLLELGSRERGFLREILRSADA